MINSRKRWARVIPGVIACIVFAAPSSSLADDDDDDDDYKRGPKVEIKENGDEYKYEYEDRRCKYEYYINYRTGEEKTERKGDCRGVSPRRAVYTTSPAVWYEDEPREHRRYEGEYYERREPATSSRRLACNREVIGQVLGGIAGGVAGSQVGSGSGRKVATVAGAVIGTIIGGNVGRGMDRADNACAYQALEFAERGEAVYWRNPDADVEYVMTPAAKVRRDKGRSCREYTVSARGAGADEYGRGLACRRSDGRWEVQPG